jgi:hypothetical protein
MSLVSTKNMLIDAQNGGYAIGAFNVNRVCLQSRVFSSESLNSRLAKTWNWEFTLVNDQL